jgi:small redox-active disulfide protein 2
MKIEILGTGCPKCIKLADNAKIAAKELGIEVEIEKVSDIVEIAKRQVMMTPALIVEGEVELHGKAASVEEIKEILRRYTT